MGLPNVLCCDGPLNGERIEIAFPSVGYKFSAAFHWDEGHYELVKWPDTDEIVAYWRANASH